MNIICSSLIAADAIMLAAILTTACSGSERAELPDPVKVSVMCVGETSSAGGHVLSGTAESAKTSTVSFSVPGTITDICVETGQRVVKGQTLAHVRNSDYVNAHNIAAAELAEARDAYARLKKLHDADALPDVKWVEVQNKLKQAENAAEMSARAVSDATLTSPVTGVVSRKLANVGQTVIAAEPVFEIVSVDDIRISVDVPESEIGTIAEGQTAVVSFKELSVDSLPGTVSRKEVVANPLTRAFSVKIDIPNPEGKILPGMVGDVRLSSLSMPKGFELPSQAVQLSSDNRTFVWLVSDGKAQLRYVVADELSPQGVIVSSGLAAGDSVIVAGMQKVGSGTTVDAE